LRNHPFLAQMQAQTLHLRLNTIDNTDTSDYYIPSSTVVLTVFRKEVWK